jgi:hypothetical protein
MRLPSANGKNVETKVINWKSGIVFISASLYKAKARKANRRICKNLNIFLATFQKSKTVFEKSRRLTKMLVCTFHSSLLTRVVCNSPCQAKTLKHPRNFQIQNLSRPFSSLLKAEAEAEVKLEVKVKVKTRY